MTNDEIKLLSRMKKLVKENKKRFAIRKDRDYTKSLFELGITEEEAWNYVLRLNAYFYYRDYKPDYLTNGKALVFKMKINDMQAYIKLKIEQNNNKDEETVCLFFHKDEKERI